jgi:hypothetical protein
MIPKSRCGQVWQYGDCILLICGPHIPHSVKYDELDYGKYIVDHPIIWLSQDRDSKYIIESSDIPWEEFDLFKRLY